MLVINQIIIVLWLPACYRRDLHLRVLPLRRLHLCWVQTVLLAELELVAAVVGQKEMMYLKFPYFISF